MATLAQARLYSIVVEGGVKHVSAAGFNPYWLVVGRKATSSQARVLNTLYEKDAIGYGELLSHSVSHATHQVVAR